MGQMIKFPRARKKKHKKNEDFLVEKLPDHQQHNDLTGMTFTCVRCGNVSKFHVKGAIFRELNFYCAACGVGYKLNNPLLAANKKRKSK